MESFFSPSPNARFADSFPNSASPPIAAYSLLRLLDKRISSAFLREREGRERMLNYSHKWTPIAQPFLSLPYRRQHVGLSLIVPVGPDSKVHLFTVLILFERFSHTKDGIGWTHLNRGPKTGTEKEKGQVYDQQHLTSKHPSPLPPLTLFLPSSSSSSTIVPLGPSEAWPGPGTQSRP